jgi:putative ABC transport system permease protein
MASVKSLMPGLLVSSYACYRPAAQVMGINEKAIEVLAVLIAACALIVAMKTQLASIIERRRDIAILKAIGWTDRSVVLQVVAESVLVAVGGGALGCAAAAGILAFAPIAAWSDVPAGIGMAISLQVLAAAFGLALVGGVVAAIIPAMAAARQRPAEALRRV